MQMIVDDHLRPRDGQTIIDLGCGTGDLARMLPESVTYVGIDHNPAYLSPAQLPTSGGTHFINADLASLTDIELPRADTAVAIGVLHHLPDPVARSMIVAVLGLLKPGGRLLTVDPVFSPEQASSARIMMAMDRGRFVRHREHYEVLFDPANARTTTTIRSDINPFPYTHCIIEATNAVSAT
jgi:ubiquinone/menaquinone biosynthesis C-methylase UbiE